MRLRSRRAGIRKIHVKGTDGGVRRRQPLATAFISVLLVKRECGRLRRLAATAAAVAPKKRCMAKSSIGWSGRWISSDAATGMSARWCWTTPWYDRRASYARSILNPARISSTRSFGCSQAAKWPPFGPCCSARAWDTPAPPRIAAPVELVGKDAHGHRDPRRPSARRMAARSRVQAGRRKSPVLVSQVRVTLSSTSSRVRPSVCPSKARAMSSWLRKS